MIESHIRQVIEARHIPGLAFGIKRGHEVLQEGYFGLANVEHKIPVSDETCFEIASVTKLFTSQAILRLVQDGRAELDQSVAGYLPQLPQSWRPVTLRHCLAHQSGIPSYTSIARYWEMTRQSKSNDTVLELIRELPVSFEPGTRHAYDNTGFYLLGMVIEAITGKSYGDYLRDIIFEPLAMTHTQANDYARIIPHRAQGYVNRDGVLANKDYYDISNTFSAGILLSTVRDLLKWSETFTSDLVLNEASRKLWWTIHPSHANNEQDNQYSLTLGWFIVAHPLATFYGHNGGIEGFASAYLHFPATHTTAVLLCNTNQVNDPHAIALQLLSDLGLL